jgi:RNA polymerase sigma-70 factor (ECF subfamily)
MRAEFEEHRRWLWSIAYRMLGSAADAEDAVQETYVRASQAWTADIENPKAYLATILTRHCLNHLESARVKREQYVGVWLPEPVLTEPRPEDPAELSESLSLAFLVVLESLGPEERAVFLLREVFDYDYAEIARVLDKSEASCRQMYHRARQRIGERKPRFESSRERRSAVARRFAESLQSGDIDSFLAVLSPEVELHSDGGGKVRAAINPVLGADRVARFFFGVLKKQPEGQQVRFTEANGMPAFVAYLNGNIRSVVMLGVVEDRVERVYVVVNPDKLVGLGVAQ